MNSDTCLFLECRSGLAGVFTVYAEAFRPQYSRIQGFLATLAEAISRPPLLHEFRITPFSLGAALSHGISETMSLDFFWRHCYGVRAIDGSETELFKQLKHFLISCFRRYNLARVVIEGEATFLLCKDESIAQIFSSDSIILSLLASPQVEHRVFSWEGEVKSFPFLVAKSRSVSKVLCERCVLLGYPLCQQYDYESDTSLRSTNICLHSQTRPRSYQVDAVEAATKEGVLNSGCLLLPCGAGKTLVGIMLLCKVKKPTLIVCAGSVSVDQWKNQIMDYATYDSIHEVETKKRGSNSMTTRISCITGKQKDDVTDETDIVITTYSMLVSAFKQFRKKTDPFRDAPVSTRSRKRKADPKENLFSSFGLLLLDEVHVIPADAFRESISFLDAKAAIGLTATYVREDRKILDLFHLVGPKLYDVSMESLVRMGFLANVECIEVHTPMTREFGLEYMDQSGRRSSAGRLPIMVLLAASNPHKMMCVHDLVARHVAAGAKILVFCDHILLLQEYAAMLQAPVVYGGTQLKERLMIFSDFQTTSKVNVICISRVGDVSVNLPSANVVIQVSSHGGSRRQEAQRLGRILRPKDSAAGKGETQAWFYSIVSTDTLEMQYAAHRTAFLVDQGYATRLIEYVPPDRSPAVSPSEDKGAPETVIVGDDRSIKREELHQALTTTKLVGSSLDKAEKLMNCMSPEYQLHLLAKIVSKWELEYQRDAAVLGDEVAPASDDERIEGNDDDVVLSSTRTLASIKNEWSGNSAAQVEYHGASSSSLSLQQLVGVDDAFVYYEL